MTLWIHNTSTFLLKNVFFKEITTFIQQEYINLIKSERKEN